MSAIEQRPARKKGLALVADWWRAMPLLVKIATVTLLVIVVVGALAALIAPYDFRATNLRARFTTPFGLSGSWAHPFGTDDLGRDMFSRLIYAIRISVALALMGTVIAAVVGSFLGFVAAHRRGIVEEGIMLLVDTQASLPFILIALAVLAFFGTDFWLFVLILGLNGWEKFARLVRGSVLSAKETGYALAARTLGAGPWRLYGRHILPNIANVLIVQFTLNLPDTILLETTLSFLGFGVQPPLTSLGQMLGSGRNHLLTSPWITLMPGLVIIAATLSISLIGDWLRDQLDPTTRRR